MVVRKEYILIKIDEGVGSTRGYHDIGETIRGIHSHFWEMVGQICDFHFASARTPFWEFSIFGASIGFQLIETNACCF